MKRRSREFLGRDIPEEPKPAAGMLDTFPMDSDPKKMAEAVKDGTVTEATITAAARRVLYEMDRFGYLDGHQKHNVTPQDIEKNAAVILKTSEDAAVLLKNDGGVLPLKGGAAGSVALIGPGALQVDAIGTFGERSGGIVERQVGPAEALAKVAPGTKFVTAVDDDMTGKAIPAAVLSSGGKPGLARTVDGGSASTDAQIDFVKGSAAGAARGEWQLPVEGNAHCSDGGRLLDLLAGARSARPVHD